MGLPILYYLLGQLMTKKIHRVSFWKLSLWMYLFATGTSFALPANTLTLLTFEGVGDFVLPT